MIAKEWLKTWVEEPNNKKLSKKVIVLDEKTFCFKKVIVKQIDYSKDSNSIIIVFECCGIKGKITSIRVDAFKSNYPLVGIINKSDLCIMVSDIGNSIMLAITNESNDLYIEISTLEATISSI